MAAPMAGAAARGIAAALAGHLAGGGGGAPAPPGGGGHHRVRPSTALIIAIVIGALVAISSFIALGLTVGWLWGFVVAIVAGPLLAFGLFAWMIHPPTPPATPAPAAPAPAPGVPAPAAPAPAAGAAPAAPANSSHAFIGVLLGCFATVITSIIAVEIAAMMTDRGGIRVVAFLAPYAIGGVIGTVAYFRHGTS